MQSLSSLLVPGARVAVVGSRDFPVPSLVEAFVVDLPEGVCVVSGASGAVDETAAEAARFAGLQLDEFRPDWRFGKRGGPMRNSRLVDSGLQALCVFLSVPGRPSAGSADVVRKARRAGVPVFVFGPEGEINIGQA